MGRTHEIAEASFLLWLLEDKPGDPPKFEGQAGRSFRLTATVETPMPELASVQAHLVAGPDGRHAKTDIVKATVRAWASLAFGMAGLLALVAGITWLVGRGPRVTQRSPGVDE